MLPKIAFFASSIDELDRELRPAIENILIDMNISTDKILVNVGDDTITKNDDLREFKNLDTPGSNKQFILLVNKGKEGWNCRSLFAVALHREPKSKVFVLQATMRCLRQIGDFQHTAMVFLSSENADTLNNELKSNFNVSIDEFGNSKDSSKVAKVKIVPPPVTVKIKRTKKLFKIAPKKIADHVNFKLKDVNVDKYRITESRRNLDDISVLCHSNCLLLLITNATSVVYAHYSKQSIICKSKMQIKLSGASIRIPDKNHFRSETCLP